MASSSSQRRYTSPKADKTVLNRIIIGPYDYPIQVGVAIGDALTKAEIDEPLDVR